MNAAEVAYWLKGELRQNFGDYLSEFFREELFYPLGRPAQSIHLIGSVIDGSYISPVEDGPDGNREVRPEERVVFWGCGLRQQGGLTQEQWRRTEILSVRGPLSASELRLGVAVPQGDPALLLPALYQPSRMDAVAGKSVCIPHFLDARSDSELLEISGCDILLRPNIMAGSRDVRLFIDTIVSAEFVLSAALHGAVVAAAYLRPFGFWDNGRIDIPFKWADFAASVGISARFHPNCDAARLHFETAVKDRLSIPSMLDSLAVAPLLPRPEALLKVLRYELGRLPPEQRLPTFDSYVLKFELQRGQHNAAFDDLLAQQKAALAIARGEVSEAMRAVAQALAASAQAVAETAQARRAAMDARIGLEQAQRIAADAAAAAEQARRETWEARAAADQARHGEALAQNALEAMRRSSSWRATRLLRAGRLLSQRHFGQALLEIGVAPRQVERLAARVGYRTPSLPPILRTEDEHPELADALRQLPARAQRAYLNLVAKVRNADRPEPDRVTATAQAAANLPLGEAKIRPRLALVSPLPPDLTGIADYSAELLPELKKHYNVELIVDQDAAAEGSHQGQFEVRNSTWLRENIHNIDRVVYHVGNSPFHKEVLDLLEEIPGVVVLHDFYLGHLVANADIAQFAPNRWVQALYQSHGYDGVSNYYSGRDKSEVLFRYPANYPIIENALGVVVHSESSRQLARNWYGEHAADGWKIIPHLRKINNIADKADLRGLLGLAAEDFVVCSFGDVGPAKLNHRLLASWLSSELSASDRCVLIFAGQSFKGEYEARLQEMIKADGRGTRIVFTGRCEMETYRQYLAVADLGVQLRTLSRGETSGTVLDCLSNAMPVIVNANGSMAELHPDAVWMLADEFLDAQLVEALEVLWRDAERRVRLGRRGLELVAARHDPGRCGLLYAEAIELFYAENSSRIDPIGDYIQNAHIDISTEAARRAQALKLAPLLAGNPPARRIFLDITATARSDIKTGIERVARAITVSLLKAPPAGYRIEPVYLTHEGGEWHYRCAIKYTLELQNCPSEGWLDDLMIPHKGDILIGLDISGDALIRGAASGVFEQLRAAGVPAYWMVYDLLPIRMPEYFPENAETNHKQWLEAVMRLDGAICISRSVADDLASWLNDKDHATLRPFKIGWSHLGADVENSAPSFGLPANAETILQQLDARRTFLLVGTIEPRKGYLQVIEAFSQLWKQGHDINLVIVGKEGWIGLSQDLRRTIPKIVDSLKTHNERGRRLFWLEGISDEYLEKAYAAADCMIIASENEGFGLPLIEAARHNLPVIARDIGVFREIAGQHAYYFSGLTAADLAAAVVAWLAKYQAKEHPRSGEISWLTWEQSARRLLQIILQDDFQSIIFPAQADLMQQDWQSADF